MVGAILLTTMIVLELDDGIPVAISQPRYERWPLLSDGRIDRFRVMKEPVLVVERLLPPPTAGTVVRAESRFELKRHQAEATWQSTRDQITSLVTAMEQTSVAVGLARLILRER